MSNRKIDCSLYLVAAARERGYTWKEIAAALKCTENGLHLYLERYGYEEPATRSTARPEYPLNIEALRCQGVSIRDYQPKNFTTGAGG